MQPQPRRPCLCPLPTAALHPYHIPGFSKGSPDSQWLFRENRRLQKGRATTVLYFIPVILWGHRMTYSFERGFVATRNERLYNVSLYRAYWDSGQGSRRSKLDRSVSSVSFMLLAVLLQLPPLGWEIPRDLWGGDWGGNSRA